MCKIAKRVESPTITRNQEISATRLSDGRIELIVQDSSLKTLGKGRWHTETICMTLTAAELAQLVAA